MKTGIQAVCRISATLVTAGSVVTAGAVVAPAAYAAPPKAPSIVAKGGFLMDAASGRTYFGKYADTRLSTGSTTKIMTAQVVLSTKGLNLDTKVTIQKAYSDYIVSKGASSARLIVGDKVSIRQLLYGLMLPSGCDAAYALADKVGTGSTRAARVKSFIGKMNATAKSLGMKNTRFDSFDGISNGSNYSTPRDLSKLAAQTMKNNHFKAIVKTRSTTQRVTTKNGGYRNMSWTNTNKLLGSYAGAIGVKTGSGPQAKYCLVFAATRGKRTVVGTVLASTNEVNRTTDAKKIMDYGFKL
ncbi:D-alanyl-D-alanine carboxypeptidase family protein [Streptomyces candidus]|uniref:D-alanyl-D-alanine carboxypeptidase (Penicillin-binding protein 5/6) n=1 Tax=Streptomyces candidus TaxID=67283 RepID=A0A7X0HD84_9ACTN|nr:serine hydrolase [Streptomyces candidus]MBB6435459.1 D-alanyl-D-alanine carboxypeptidase (penicillin-binding protein 5/6) [Streptomyces candidus]GHH47390.1 D-alanyl-D-alanine carboxypeptidase [Streptomyces candidus]